MQRILSFEQGPTIDLPLRFFLTAPLFSAAAAGVMLWHGPSAFLSRWSPVTLAVTHLLVLGFLALTMIGSLMQMLPVVAGVSLPRPRRVAVLVHAGTAAGTACLASAFLLAHPGLFAVAMALLGSSFLYFLWSCWRGMRGAADASATFAGMRWSLRALGITVGLGLTLASGFAWNLPLPLVPMTDLHALWGLGGWVGLLVIGVAYQVVPMFQLTPVYPVLLTRRLVPMLFCLLAAASAAVVTVAGGGWLSRLATAAVALAYVAFAATTLFLFARRKRPKLDATTLYWYASLCSLLAAAALALAGSLRPGLVAESSYPLALGVLVIVGFGCSVVNGMLYKIVPFLAWYHLQERLAGGRVKAPNVRQLLGDKSANGQFMLHLLSLLLLLAAVLYPGPLARPAAAAGLLSASWLWLNLLRPARIYRAVLLLVPSSAAG